MVDVWFVSRCLVLTIFVVFGTGFLCLSIRLERASWPARNLGASFTVAVVNGTNVENLDPHSVTVKFTRTYIPSLMNHVGSIVGAVTASVSFFELIYALMKWHIHSFILHTEILWTAIMSIFWLATTIISIMDTPFPIAVDACSDSLCLRVQKFKLLSFLMWLMMSCYLMMLLLLVGLGIGRGQRQVFEMSAVTGELFSRRSLQNQATLGNVYTVSAQLRPCVGSHCGQNDNTTACSTPSCSVRVQSIPLVSNTTLSTPYDASFTHSGIRPVTIMSPPSPLFQAPVTVGSNEGVTNTLHKTADTLV